MVLQWNKGAVFNIVVASCVLSMTRGVLLVDCPLYVFHVKVNYIADEDYLQSHCASRLPENNHNIIWKILV